MEKQFDVIALGEILVDFVQAGVSPQGNEYLECCPGGAVANVLSLLAKLGKKTSFVGKVGDDAFGKMLTETLVSCGINTENVMVDKKVHTTLAIVHTFENGDRDFSFYREPGADMMISASEVDPKVIKSAKIFHHGTLSMTHEGCREATKKAIEAAKEAGLLISFDPNLREPLWEDLELCKEQMAYGFSKCDILKIADNEIQFVTGKEDYEEGIKLLRDKYNIPLVLLTLGGDGSRAYYKDMRVEVPGFKVDTIETTGAGDTFLGSILYYLLDQDINCLTEENLKEALSFANAAAAIVTSRKGAIKSMPSLEEIKELLK